MKFNGEKLDKPNVEVLVIPRNDKDIVIKAQAVLDYASFEMLCPAPKPPVKMVPGGEKITNPEDPEYIKRIDDWAAKKSTWMILKSLEATPGLEWETIKKDDPETWDNYQKELEEAFFSDAEIGRIINTVSTACGLNQDKIDEAMKRFLATQGQQPKP